MRTRYDALYMSRSAALEKPVTTIASSVGVLKAAVHVHCLHAQAVRLLTALRPLCLLRRRVASQALVA